jgi:hypothetical protein
MQYEYNCCRRHSTKSICNSQEITERITSDLRRVIGEVENNTSQGQHVKIKCEFGMTLEDMRCHFLPLPQAGQGE